MTIRPSATVRDGRNRARIPSFIFPEDARRRDRATRSTGVPPGITVRGRDEERGHWRFGRRDGEEEAGIEAFDADERHLWRTVAEKVALPLVQGSRRGV